MMVVMRKMMNGLIEALPSWCCRILFVSISCILCSINPASFGIVLVQDNANASRAVRRRLKPGHCRGQSEASLLTMTVVLVALVLDSKWP